MGIDKSQYMKEMWITSGMMMIPKALVVCPFLSPTEKMVMSYLLLAHFSDRVTQSEIAGHLNVSKSTVAKCLVSLAKKDLIGKIRIGNGRQYGINTKHQLGKRLHGAIYG